MTTEARVDSPCNGCTQCPCPGKYTATIEGVGEIPSYTGGFPSPIAVWYVPKDAGELTKVFLSPAELRGWVREAADYEGVPLEIAAVILQQENAPEAPTWRKLGQVGERNLTTFLAILDEALFDLVPDTFADGSSGLPNLRRPTLRDAARYIEETYCKPILPDEVKNRLLGWNQDTRIPGDDVKADLYYMTGHIRQLIDRITGKRCYDGPLTPDQIERVFAAYNGSGEKAKKYGRDAMGRLRRAAAGTESLYFYQK